VAILVLADAAAIVVHRKAKWLDRDVERAYAALVLAAAGGWLAAAIAFGPTSVLRSLLLFGTVLAGIPWWWHRRRRARVRLERKLSDWPAAAETFGLAGSSVQSAVLDRWGWRARVRLRRGQTYTDALNQQAAIESGLGTRPGAVRVEPDADRADRFVLRVLESDPHAGPISWAGPSVSSIADPIELGIYEDATPCAVPLLRRHGLVGGIAGSGKSGVLNVIIANLVACPDVVLWGIDLKAGMELQPWAACLERLATTPGDASDLLADAVTVLETRAEQLADEGARTWEPTPDEPALVVLIDEYAELTDEAPAAIRYADSIARRGRAPAVTLLVATQRPTQQAMGKSAVRSQMDVRICLRVRERRDVDLILGQGMLAAGWHAHTLDAPGKFLATAPGIDRPRRARAYLVADDVVRAAAAHQAGMRPRLKGRAAIDQPAAEDAVDSDAALLAALHNAPGEGLSFKELVAATGKGRTWIYKRLDRLVEADRVVRVARGRWRANK
jgi:S-DNA-T family DNA segregation ATPase FtsK/SpoIIIE